MVKPLLYQNGGPILMIQVENDYGEAVFQDPNYMPFIRDLLLSQLGNDTVLYTGMRPYTNNKPKKF